MNNMVIHLLLIGPFKQSWYKFVFPPLGKISRFDSYLTDEDNCMAVEMFEKIYLRH